MISTNKGNVYNSSMCLDKEIVKFSVFLVNFKRTVRERDATKTSRNQYGELDLTMKLIENDISCGL